MSVSTPWTNSTPASTARLNKVTVPSDTGANLAGYDKTKYRLVFCTATGGGLTVNHLYLVNAAEDAFIDLGVVSDHNHTSGNGGEFINIMDGNWLYTDLFLSKVTNLQKANWNQTVTSTGTIEDATDGTTGERSIRLRPNGTSGASATINYPHISLDFAKRAIYEQKVRIETASSLAYHGGVGADDITATDSNTRKFQVEVCTVTNNNWWLRTANGSANSASDSGIAISTNRTWLYVITYPDIGTPEIDLYIDDNTALQKTTHIPTSSSTAHINIIKHSIKNSTGADRPIHIYPSRLRYYMTDKWV